MKSFNNIESRKLAKHHDYYVGYRRAGPAIRIYGRSGAWRVDCKVFATLAEVSAYLLTL